MLGIGIDTGGTCTDAVIYDFETEKVLYSGKANTTKSNLEIGIANALDTLPQDLVQQAGNIALSTTLATNACLENKGARAKLLLIGFQEEMMDYLKETFANYGMKDMTRFLVLEARPEAPAAEPKKRRDGGHAQQHGEIAHIPPPAHVEAVKVRPAAKDDDHQQIYDAVYRHGEIRPQDHALIQRLAPFPQQEGDHGRQRVDEMEKEIQPPEHHAVSKFMMTQE